MNWHSSVSMLRLYDSCLHCTYCWFIFSFIWQIHLGRILLCLSLAFRGFRVVSSLFICLFMGCLKGRSALSYRVRGMWFGLSIFWCGQLLKWLGKCSGLTSARFPGDHPPLPPWYGSCLSRSAHRQI